MLVAFSLANNKRRFQHSIASRPASVRSHLQRLLVAAATLFKARDEAVCTHGHDAGAIHAGHRVAVWHHAANDLVLQS